jgi:hypothetical protein
LARPSRRNASRLRRGRLRRSSRAPQAASVTTRRPLAGRPKGPREVLPKATLQSAKKASVEALWASVAFGNTSLEAKGFVRRAFGPSGAECSARQCCLWQHLSCRVDPKSFGFTLGLRVRRPEGPARTSRPDIVEAEMPRGKPKA